MILYLREIMKLNRVTSVELASRLGVTKATVSYWINGRFFPTADALEKIASALGVEVWQLFRDPSAPCLDGCRCPHCGKPLKIAAG